LKTNAWFPHQSQVVLLEDPQLTLLLQAAIQGAPKSAEAKAKLLIQQLLSSHSNLEQLARALRSYHDAHKRLPGPAITDKNGKPLLSWRVAILPHLEGGSALHRQFKLDEPWDSLHNKKLLEQMPSLYVPSGVKTKAPFTTYYQAFTGPGTAFEPGMVLRIPGDFPDGLSNTALLVETGGGVPWTKPEDVPFDPKNELPELGGPFPSGFHIVMGDGRVRRVSRDFDRLTLRGAITRNGGEAIELDKLDPKKQ
jgi:hypothetical protein